MSQMEWNHLRKISCCRGVEEFWGGGQSCAKIKGYSEACCWVGFSLIRRKRRQLRCFAAGFLDRGSTTWSTRAGACASNCLTIECDCLIERKFSSTWSRQHVHVREEEWAVVYRDVVDGKESKTECVIVLRAQSWEIEMCDRNELSGFRAHPSIPKSETSVLTDLMTKSVKKLMVEPSATVGLGLCSYATHDVFYDSLFTPFELSTLQPWLVRLAKESDCTVTDCGSHVKLVVTRGNGKLEKDLVTLNEQKGEVTFVEEGYDVEYVMVILKNVYCYEIHQRNIRDKARAAFGLRSVVVKDTMSAMVKLARQIDESASDVVGYGMVSHPMTSSRDKLLRAMLSFLSRSADCGMLVDGVSFQEKAGYMMRSMRLILTNKVLTDNIWVNEVAQEIIFRSVKGGVEDIEERVLALRTEPLRCQIHCREVSSRCESIGRHPVPRWDKYLTSSTKRLRTWTDGRSHILLTDPACVGLRCGWRPTPWDFTRHNFTRTAYTCGHFRQFGESDSDVLSFWSCRILFELSDWVVSSMWQ